jgi:Cellulose binding domain
MSVITLPRARAARLIPTAAVALTLAAAIGTAVAQGLGGTGTGGMSTAPGPGRTPTMAPSVTASSTAPGPAGTPQASQPTRRGTPARSVTRPPSMRATASPVIPPAAGPAAPTTTLPAPATARPAITVMYRVVSRWSRGFEGEVAVVNNGPSPISDWQIVVALPDDQFTAVSKNASGYVSHHILLLHPASYANPVPANGTLSVFFTTYGTELTPELCAFNDTTCG